MPDDEHIPLPAVDSDSRPFWDGVSQGKLRLQQCDVCHRSIFYPRSHCPQCGADVITWRDAAGTGTIYSYTVVHQGFGPFAAQTPFAVALIDLDEGARMLSRITGSSPGEIRIGQRVRVAFVRADPNLTLPYFELIS
jgi:uncharacterized OB-fold protein